MATEAMSAFVRFFVQDDVTGEAGRVEQSARRAASGMDEAANAGGSRLRGAMSAAGTAAKVGGVAIAGIAGAAATAVGGLMGLASAAQDSVEDMGKLDVAFNTLGWTSEDATGVYRNMVGVLGETDQSVEAANHLAELCNTEEELAAWTDISAGVYAKFGDSLPLEGLTEAANETAKVGQVIGPFADTLNWATMSTEGWTAALGGHGEALDAFNAATAQGMSAEDAFNAALATTSSEQERAQMVTDTLTGLYGEAGQQYQETNKALIDSRQAQADWTNAMGEAGKAVMPLQSSILGFGASLLSSVVPNLQQVGTGLSGMFEGREGAAQEFTQGITGVLTGLVGKLAEMLPTLLQAGVGIIQGLLQGIVTALPTLIEGLTAVLPQLITSLMEIITMLVTSLGEMLPTILPMIVEAIAGMAVAFVEALPALIEGLVGVITALAESLPTLIPTLIEAAFTLFMAIVQALPQIIDALVGALPTVITALINTLPTMIPALINGSIQLFMAIVQALPQIIGALVSATPQVIYALINNLPSFLSALGSAAFTLFNAIVDALPRIGGSLLGALRGVLDGLPGAITGFASRLGSAAYDMVRGMVSGIQDAGGAVWDAITRVCSGALDSVKSFFGIASPSKVFRATFRWVPEGAALGIDDEAGAPVKSLTAMGESMRKAAAGIGANIELGAIATVGDMTGRAKATAQTVYNVTSNVTTGETDAAKLARLIMRNEQRQANALGTL